MIQKIKENKFYFVLGLIVLVSIVQSILSSYFDTDAYFLLNEGREIVESRSIPKMNTGNIVDGMSIVVQQWLYCVLLYSIYSAAGRAGMVLFVILLTLLLAWCLYRLAGYYHVDKTVTVVMILVFFLFLRSFLTVRPFLITMILLIGQLCVCEHYKQNRSRKNAWFTVIAVTMIVWLEINLHCSMWIFHFLYLLPYVFPRIPLLFQMSEREYDIKPLWLTYIPMTAVLFLNPYRLDGILYLFRSYNSKIQEVGIVELSVPLIYDMNTIFTFLNLFLLIVFCIAKKKKISPEVFYLVAGNTILGTICLRNMQFVLIGTFVLVIYLLRDMDFSAFHKYINEQSKGVMLLSLLGFVFAVSQMDPAEWNTKTEDGDSTPIAAVEYLDKEADKDIRLYTGFNDGAFMAWNGYTIYMDACPELYMKSVNKKEDVISEYIKVMYDIDLEYYKAFMEKYDFDYMLVPDSTPLFHYLETDPGAEAVVKGNDYVLFKTAAAD